MELKRYNELLLYFRGLYAHLLGTIPNGQLGQQVA